MEIRFQKWKSLYDTHFQLSKHKFFEFQLMWDARRWIAFEFDWSWTGEDHAGPRLNIALLGIEAAFSIYDRRHWAIDQNDWERCP